MKTLKIDRNELENVLNEQIHIAMNFPWTGWRIPIYCNDKGELSPGNWLSYNSYQPGSLEIYSIERWLLSDMTDNDNADESEIDDIVELMTDEVIRNIDEFWESKINYDVYHFELVEEV